MPEVRVVRESDWKRRRIELYPLLPANRGIAGSCTVFRKQGRPQLGDNPQRDVDSG